MAEPKVRFRQDDGTPYPALRNGAMGDYYIERNERGEKGLPMLTVSIHSGISDGELNEEELGKRVNRSADVMLYKKAVKGDLVFNMMRAWQGAVGSTKCTGMVSPAYIVASPNKEIDPTFMNYYVQTKTIITRFNRLSYGALDFRKRLYWDSFIAAEVNIPIIEEQQKIAGFLSSVDEAITASEQEVTNLETQKKAVIKKIFSQEVRFKKKDGSDFSEWQEKPLNYFLSENKERNKEKKYTKTNVLTVSKDYGVVNQIEYLGKSLAGEDLSNYHCVYAGDVIYTKSPLGKQPYGIIKTSKSNGIVSTLYAVYHCNERVLPELIDYYFSNDVVLNNYLKPLVNIGAKHDMKVHNDVAITGLVCFPSSIEEQRLIVDFLSGFDEANAAAKKELELWNKLKKGLLQQMFG